MGRADVGHDVDVPGERPGGLLGGLRTGAADARVGAVHVDRAAQRVAGLADDRRGVAGDRGAADLVGDGLRPSGVQVVDDDPGPLGGEAPGQRGADAASRPGDDDSGILHGFHHRSPSTRLGTARSPLQRQTNQSVCAAEEVNRGLLHSLRPRCGLACVRMTPAAITEVTA